MSESTDCLDRILNEVKQMVKKAKQKLKENKNNETT